MTRPRNDATDDLLTHIRRGPGRDAEGWSRTYERLHRAAPEVLNDRPTTTEAR